MKFVKPILTVITLCPFICFRVTADLNPSHKDTSREFLFQDSLLGDGRHERSLPYQNAPLLSGPSKTEEWIPDPGWPQNNVKLGQVGGVTVNSKGEVVVFHRGDRIWGAQTFDRLNQYQEKELGPIASSTVLVFHPKTGAVLQQWGEHMFYLPHGITIDKDDNVWLTDVALHQVFKFPPLTLAQKSPLLTLGKPFTPGNSAVRFCKPTSTAILDSGDFFVADGYCNSRLVKFNKAGEKILEIGRSTVIFGLSSPGPYNFQIPHALTLVPDKKTCVCSGQGKWASALFRLEQWNICVPNILSGNRLAGLQSHVHSSTRGPIFCGKRCRETLWWSSCQRVCPLCDQPATDIGVRTGPEDAP